MSMKNCFRSGFFSVYTRSFGNNLQFEHHSEGGVWAEVFRLDSLKMWKWLKAFGYNMFDKNVLKGNDLPLNLFSTVHRHLQLNAKWIVLRHPYHFPVCPKFSVLSWRTETILWMSETANQSSVSIKFYFSPNISTPHLDRHSLQN